MSELAIGFVALATLYAFQQFFFLKQIQKLVDKVMSRSFGEYQRAQEPVSRVKMDAAPAEDLRTLQEFQM